MSKNSTELCGFIPSLQERSEGLKLVQVSLPYSLYLEVEEQRKKDKVKWKEIFIAASKKYLEERKSAKKTA